MGYECAKNILESDEWFVIIASRDIEKSNRVIEGLKRQYNTDHIMALGLDLASFTSIRSFVRDFGAISTPPLKAIVCNSGIQIVGETQYTKDGIEKTFGVNHLGHFLLIHLLLRHIDMPGRIILVSSGTHDPEQRTLMPSPNYTTAKELAHPSGDAPEEDMEKLGRMRYSTSKLCNVLNTYELVRQFEKNNYNTYPRMITVNAFEPGLMPGTGLASDYNPMMRLAWTFILPLLIPFGKNINTVKQSGKALARLVTDPELEKVTGKYFNLSETESSSRESYDLEKARELWNTSIELVHLSQEDTILDLQK